MKTYRSLGLRLLGLLVSAAVCFVLWCLDAHAMEAPGRWDRPAKLRVGMVMIFDENAVPRSVLERCREVEDLEKGRHEITLHTETSAAGSALLIEGDTVQPIVVGRTETVHVRTCGKGTLWVCPLSGTPLKGKLSVKSEEQDPLETQVDEDPLVDPCVPWKTDRFETMVDSED